MTTQSLHLHTELVPRGPAGAVVLTAEQVAGLGGGKRAPVTVTTNGRTIRLRVAPMGDEFLIGFSKQARAQLGVEIGDPIEVVISLDDQERTIEAPADLAAALASDPAADKAFAALSYTHRKEFVQWVNEAKRDETRTRRIAGTVEMLKTGRTR